LCRHKLDCLGAIGDPVFEMDFNSMRTFKINDRIEFPAVLNMKPYTKVRKKEREGASSAEQTLGTSADQLRGTTWLRRSTHLLMCANV
jgi:hypothetical protein